MVRVLYPSGSLWLKRLSHLAIICTISLSLFLNEVQSRLFEIGQQCIGLANDVSRPMVSAADYIGQGIQRNKTRIEQSNYKWLLDYITRVGRSFSTGANFMKVRFKQRPREQ